ncbi:MAG: cysteine--tRNA ligase [Clostridiales bacterium GWF2_36_10]|nr:MAG: cysteine--tRNA ligase [Clostridiales bacterium GWF2_36_10]HAN21623.1 cysteine--tRNA ligase [Clostridiales bacterium]
MKLYNTLTRKKEEFIVKNNTVRMYVCGPTVYNYFHVGNARCFVVFDLLRRYLEFQGNKVTYVQNFTDVDDKLIRKAAEEGITVPEVADKYIKEYFVDAKGLGINDATFHPKATENIDRIIEIIEKLIENGNAYVSGGDVYFDQKSFTEYGKLSHANLEDLEAGARIDVNEIKKNPFDFTLWKAKKEGEISWNSPWGEGRPGWHIECSAMVNKFLGTEIDIHGGGPDLIFPHHENEIAQSECATGHPMSRFWLHIGFINVDNRKMSKSLGNFFMVRDAAKKYGYTTIRYFLLSSHYRSPINFSGEILEQSSAAIDRLHNCAENLRFRLKNNVFDDLLVELENVSLSMLELKQNQFFEALDDDFNTADAIGYLFEITREINTRLSEQHISKGYLDRAYEIFMGLCSLLGFEKAEDKGIDTSFIEQMIEKRTTAKKARDFTAADAIRNELKEMGIILEDTPQGVKWKKA